MLNNIVLFTVAMILISVDCLAGSFRFQDKNLEQENPIDEIAVRVAKFEKMQSERLDLELGAMKARLALSDNGIKTIKDSLELQISNAAARIEKFTDREETQFVRTNLEPELHHEFWAACQAQAPESKKVDIERYVESQRQLKNSRESNDQAAIMLFLDGLASLSDEQDKMIRPLLAECWQPFWERNVSLLLTGATDDLDPIFESIGKSRLKEILNDEQFDVLSRRGGLEVGAMLSLKQKNDSAEELDLEIFRETCARIMELRIAQIDRRFNLDKRQRLLFSIATKGSIVGVVERWREIEAMAKADPGGVEVFLEVVRNSNQPIPTLCGDQKAWQQTVRKALSDEQFQEYELNVQQQAIAQSDQILTHLVQTSIIDGSGIKLDYDQYLRFTELLYEQLGEQRLRDWYDAILFLGKADHAKFEACFEEEQWLLVKKILGKIKDYSLGLPLE